MKPLIVLLIVFLISVPVTKLVSGTLNFHLSGKIAMSTMLIFTATGHFIFTKGMTLMIPDIIPTKNLVVQLSGVFEILLAITILIPRYSTIIGWILIVFLLTILPANIYGAIREINYQTATFDGPGLTYLWFRIPLQLVFITWTYFFIIKH